MFVHRGRLRPGTAYPRRGFPAQWLDLVQDRSGGRWHSVYGHLARVTGRLPEGETKLQAAGSASARPMATCAGRSRLAGPARDPAGQRPRCREPDTERHHDDRSSDELRADDPPAALGPRVPCMSTAASRRTFMPAWCHHRADRRGFMPSRSRAGRNRRTASSYRAKVAANDTATSAAYAGRAGAFQRTMNHPAATITGSCSR
jgi:hypothetical protein